MRFRKNLCFWQCFGKLKRAQEEIVGFVAIVLIITIVLAIFLGIFIRRPQIEIKSNEYSQLLDSMLQYTSQCAISFEPNYLSLGELLMECNNGISMCTDGKNPCVIAEETVEDILNSVFNVDENSYIKGYEFYSYYYLLDNNGKITNKREIIKITKGNITGNYQGGEKLTPGNPGTISTKINVYQ